MPLELADTMAHEMNLQFGAFPLLAANGDPSTCVVDDTFLENDNFVFC
jgi:hypothetical protein